MTYNYLAMGKEEPQLYERSIDIQGLRSKPKANRGHTHNTHTQHTHTHRDKHTYCQVLEEYSTIVDPFLREEHDFVSSMIYHFSSRLSLTHTVVTHNLLHSVLNIRRICGFLVHDGDRVWSEWASSPSCQ